MSLISIIKPVSHHFGDQELFHNVAFSVEKNSRIGLVGKNGSGKSTLFKILTKRMIPNQGEVQIAKKCNIAYLTQEPELNEEETLYQSVWDARPDLIDLHEKLVKAEKQLAKKNTDENLKRFSIIQTDFENNGGYDFETEMKLVLTSLDLMQEIWNQKIKSFSGGEKTRLQLAKFLLSSFDLLLLDEPTNHLDLKMIYWLENYLKKIEKPYVIISHDRNFLDNTVLKIAEIKNGKLSIFHCNYSNYEKEIKQRYDVQKKEFKRQQKWIEETQKFIQKNMAGQKVQQAKSRLKMLEKTERIGKPQTENTIRINLKAEHRSGNDVFVFNKASIGFPEKKLAENINLRVGYQDRIAVLGANGCGKTTLLRIMNGELECLAGKAKKGASLSIGYYDQMHINLDETKTVQEIIWSLAPMETRGYILSYLARYGFTGDEVEKKVSILSGGEKARLYLAKLIHEKPNFLLLDEPTNHLDIQLISSLEKAFNEFDGTILFVSHDRYFINRVATKKWFFTNHTIIETEKTLDELFFTKVIKKNQDTRTKVKNTKINPYYYTKLQKDIEIIEKKIVTNEQKINKCHDLFAKPEIMKNQEKIKEIQKEIKLLQNENLKLNSELDKHESTFIELLEREEKC